MNIVLSCINVRSAGARSWYKSFVKFVSRARASGPSPLASRSPGSPLARLTGTTGHRGPSWRHRHRLRAGVVRDHIVATPAGRSTTCDWST